MGPREAGAVAMMDRLVDVLWVVAFAGMVAVFVAWLIA